MAGRQCFTGDAVSDSDGEAVALAHTRASSVESGSPLPPELLSCTATVNICVCMQEPLFARTAEGQVQHMIVASAEHLAL